jgi:hypothetical protein
MDIVGADANVLRALLKTDVRNTLENGHRIQHVRAIGSCDIGIEFERDKSVRPRIQLIRGVEFADRKHFVTVDNNVPFWNVGYLVCLGTRRRYAKDAKNEQQDRLERDRAARFE